MDLHQLANIVAIEDYGNMTEAAAHLFMTPSALNQQLLKLEKELEMPLFVRVHHRMVPTAAGRVYLDSARQILLIRQNAYARLKDISRNYVGEYKIGIAYGHGNDAMLYSYPIFHRLYPGVVLLCKENMVARQMEALRLGELDLGLVQITDWGDQYPGFHYEPLSVENLLLGMPVSHPLAGQGAREPGPLPTIDLSLLRDTDFALMQRDSTSRKRTDPLFLKAGYRPHILAESTQNLFLQSLAAAQVCCTIVPQTYATDYEHLVWFALPTHPRFHLCAVYSQGISLEQPIKDLLQLIRGYAQEHFQFPEP